MEKRPATNPHDTDTIYQTDNRSEMHQSETVQNQTVTNTKWILNKNH